MFRHYTEHNPFPLQLPIRTAVYRNILYLLWEPSTLVVICVVRLLFVLFYVLFVCKWVLPPADNPTAVNKYIKYQIRHINAECGKVQNFLRTQQVARKLPLGYKRLQYSPRIFGYVLIYSNRFKPPFHILFEENLFMPG